MAVEGWIDLRELAGRLSNRSLKGRTEATVQSDVRMLFPLYDDTDQLHTTLANLGS